MTSPGPFRIALLHAGALGDAVLTLRIAAALTRAYESAHVTLYARVDLSAFLGQVDGVHAFVHLETAGLHTLFSDHAPLEPARRAELAAFDLIVNCIAGPASTLHRRLCDAASSRVISIDPASRPDHVGHITDQWLADLGHADLTLRGDTTPRIRLDSDIVRAARARMNVRATSERVVVLHPGSGGRDKCWPLACFERLAEALHEDGTSPCFLLGPVEMELHGEVLRARLARRAPVLFEESLAAAAAIATAADAYVGNDAGMTHVAAALGTRTLVLFGPTEPARWRPLGPNATVLRADDRQGDPFDGLTVDAVRREVAHTLSFSRAAASGTWPPRPT